MLDFGLSRQYINNEGNVRMPRPVAGFRGTVRYASINAHDNREMSRRDDMWSVFYMLVEFAQGGLPWRKLKDKDEVGKCKKAFDHKQLLRQLPIECKGFLEHVQDLQYGDRPNYEYLISCFLDAMSRKGIQDNDPFDWEKASADGSLTTTTASSTQGNYNPTPQGLKPDIAATNISELPRTNDPLLNDDSIKDDNARQKEKRRWSLAEGELAKDEVEQVQKRPMESVLPIDVIDGLAEGKKPKLKMNKEVALPVRLPKSFLQAMKETILKDNKMGNITSYDTQNNEKVPETSSRKEKEKLDPIEYMAAFAERRDDEIDGDKPLPITDRKMNYDFDFRSLESKESNKMMKPEIDISVKKTTLFDTDKGHWVSDDHQQKPNVQTQIPEVTRSDRKTVESSQTKELTGEAYGEHQVSGKDFLNGLDKVILNENENRGKNESDKSGRSVASENANIQMEVLKLTGSGEDQANAEFRNSSKVHFMKPPAPSSRFQAPDHPSNLTDNIKVEEGGAFNDIPVETSFPIPSADPQENEGRVVSKDFQASAAVRKINFFETDGRNIDFGADLAAAKSRILARDSIDGTYAFTMENLDRRKSFSISTKRTELNQAREEDGGFPNTKEECVPESPAVSPRKSSSDKLKQRNDSNDSRVSEGSNSRESVSKRRTRSGSEQHTSKTLSVLKNFFDTLDRRKLQLSDSNDLKIQSRMADNEAGTLESALFVKEPTRRKSAGGLETKNLELAVVEEGTGVHFTQQNTLRNFKEDNRESYKLEISENPKYLKKNLVEPNSPTFPETKDYEIQYPAGEMDSLCNGAEKAHSDVGRSLVGQQLDGKTGLTEMDLGGRLTMVNDVCCVKNEIDGGKFLSKANVKAEVIKDAVDAVASVADSVNKTMETDDNKDSIGHIVESVTRTNGLDNTHLGLESKIIDSRTAVQKEGIQKPKLFGSTVMASVSNNRPKQPLESIDEKHDNMLVSKSHVPQSFEHEKTKLLDQFPQPSTAEVDPLCKTRTLSVENFQVNVKTTNNLVPFVTTNLLRDGKEPAQYSSSCSRSLEKDNAMSDVVFKITIERSKDVEKKVGDNIEDLESTNGSDKPNDSPKQIDLSKPRFLSLTGPPRSDVQNSDDAIKNLSKSKNEFDSVFLPEKVSVVEHSAANVMTLETVKGAKIEGHEGLTSLLTKSSAAVELDKDIQKRIKIQGADRLPRPPSGRATTKPVSARLRRYKMPSAAVQPEKVTGEGPECSQG